MLNLKTGIRQTFEYNFLRFFALVGVCLSFHSSGLHADIDIDNNESEFLEISKSMSVTTKQLNRQPVVYYLYVADFANSFIEIPTSNVAVDSSTITSKYLAGRAPIYNADNIIAGTCSASFLCMQNEYGIYTDISNFITANDGLIVTWFTPTKLINLELDSIIHSMVTECAVIASTNVGLNPFYGQSFNLVVSSDDQRIYFTFTRTGAIF